jgi:endonuclease-3 related protein
MTLKSLYSSLLRHFGPQHWWPADEPFEVMVGAILTQNTSWKNVERAIANLSAAKVLGAAKILQMQPEQLAELIRPSGYFNVKAQRLRHFCHWYVEAGEFENLRLLDTERLRRALLDVNGIGRETADDMLLYAFERPVFVIDAYTKRLYSRLGISEESDYETLRLMTEAEFSGDIKTLNELHALIVSQGKDVCKKRPLCGQCVLQRECRFAANKP